MDISENLRKKLSGSGIHPLRQIGRAVGVESPTNKKKEELIDDILAIARNEAAPSPRSARGAPPKSDEFNAELVEEILKCREYYAGLVDADDLSKRREYPDERPEKAVLEARSGTYTDDEQTYSGVLEFSERFWFIRTKNMQISSTTDVFVHLSFINRFRLRTGDFIVCKARRRRENECPGVTFIISVNGVAPDSLRRVGFESLTPCYPDRRFTLESEGCSLTERVVDLFSPIGCGQRGLIVSPPKAGKTTLLKHVACALTRNYPAAEVIVLLIDERPEEVTDIVRSVSGAKVFYSTFDKGENHHIHTASLTLEYAKRLVESGKDAVILMDSITRLARAYNAVCNSGRTLSGGLDPQALVEPKKFFGAARNIEDGGSLTILATALVDTGSRLDDVIYEEFKSTGNMEIVLSRELAERRVFPAINIRASGARKEELLLSEAELAASSKLRAMMGRQLDEQALFDTLAKTESNREFCEKLDGYLKIYNR